MSTTASALTGSVPANQARLHSGMRTLLATAFLAAAAAYLLTALCFMLNFAWLQPVFDQLRLYGFYLSLPFPDNVLQLENGHRPVVPALLRVAEIHWFSANQRLQIVMGGGFAAATSLLIAWFGWRWRDMPLPVRAAAVMLAVSGVFWLANARMLLHGNEMVHAYLVTLCVVTAAAGVGRAGGSRPLLWMSVASLSCAVATFSFGAGIATFPAVIVLGWLHRLHWRALAIPLLSLVICLLVYVYALPGDDGVRAQLDFRPGAILVVSARWLSSPWIVSWLGLGDNELYGWAQQYLRPQALPAAMIAVAGGTEQLTGLRWFNTGATLVGASGLAGFGTLLLHYLRRRERPDRVETVALGLCLFTVATALVIGLGRVAYFELYPGQVFADRYLLWPCLFWLGLALLLLRRVVAWVPAARLHWALTPLLLLPIMAWPTHSLWTGWGSTVYRNAQQSAASARSDALDGRHFGENPSVAGPVILRTLELLRDRELAMYAEPGSRLLGQIHTGELRPTTTMQAHLLSVEPLQDLRDGRPIARFDGWISSGIREAQKNGFLAVLDRDNRIVGFADFSFIAPGATRLRLDWPRKRGFDGYIRHYDATARYRLVLLDGLAGNGSLLFEIGPANPP